MFYKPELPDTGRMWDVWIFCHDNSFYLYYLAGTGEWWDNFSLATSTDGVHWTERGPVIRKGAEALGMGTGSTWKSPNFDHDGKFYLNFSERDESRQTIFFAESDDLVEWTRLGDEYRFVQDERWYKKSGRWDCIWTISRPDGGLFGYWTATPKEISGIGFGVSDDGVTWNAKPSPALDWRDHHAAEELEVGAVERIGNRYFALLTAFDESSSAYGHHSVCFVAEAPDGPFTAAGKNFFPITDFAHCWFPRFFSHNGSYLVAYHAKSKSNEVSFTPIKKAWVDDEGILRLVWWEGNEGLKHESVEIEERVDSRGAIETFGNIFDTSRGVIIEGEMALPKTDSEEQPGFYFECADESNAAVFFDRSGHAEYGRIGGDAFQFTSETSVDRELTFGEHVSFRLLIMGSLTEVYLDDLLIGNFSLPTDSTGRIGLVNSSIGATRAKSWMF